MRACIAFIALVLASASAVAQTPPADQRHTGNITSRAPRASFAVELQAGQVVTLTTSSSENLDTILTLNGPNGQRVAENDDVQQGVLSSRIVHVGKAGAGQTAKMVNQICIAGVVAGLAEAVRFAQAEHLDMDKVYEAISGGAAQSWQMDNRWKTMAEDSFDFGFAIDWMRKDLGLAMDEGRGIGVSLPITALVNQFYADVQAQGGGRQDTSALIRRLPRRGSK